MIRNRQNWQQKTKPSKRRSGPILGSLVSASLFLLTLSGCSQKPSASLTPVVAETVSPAAKQAFMCTMPPFLASDMADLPDYILDTRTMLAAINKKNQNVNAYNRKLQGL
ncbi:hypothetical protein [Bacillus altitudinis]|uniref:hypothetical protein n=1 Tax=Bacillus altitudinis TaxID=293387 RepID=UPI0036735A69